MPGISPVRGPARSRPVPTARALLAASAAAMCVLAAGCDRTDEQSRKVEKARSILVSASASGSSIPAEARERQYGEAIQTLSGVEGSGAALLAGQAMAGQGQIAEARARGAISSLSTTVGDIRVLLGRYRAQSSLARALNDFSIDADLASLASQMQERDAEFAALTKSLALSDGFIGGLKTKSAEWKARSEEERARERALRDRAFSAGASERAELAKQAEAFRAEADNFEMEHLLVEATISRAAPTSDELRSELARVQSQRDLLAQSEQKIKEAAESRLADAQAAGREAEAIGREIMSAVTDRLNAAWTGGSGENASPGAKPSYEEAVSKLGSAVSKLRSARSDDLRNLGSALAATSAHAAAGLHQSYAEAMRQMVDLLRELKSDSGLGQASTLSPLLERAEQELAAAEAAAKDARAEAGGLYAGAGGGAISSGIYADLSEKLTPPPDAASTGTMPVDDSGSAEIETVPGDAPVELQDTGGSNGEAAPTDDGSADDNATGDMSDGEAAPK